MSRIITETLIKVALLLAFATTTLAQITTKAGMIQDIEGDVFLDDKLLRLSDVNTLQIKKGQLLHTEHGRVEVLMAPDTYLRLDNNSLLRIERRKLSDINASIENGSAMIEFGGDAIKSNKIRMHLCQCVVEMKKEG
jgi:hypothetical protein